MLPEVLVRPKPKLLVSFSVTIVMMMMSTAARGDVLTNAVGNRIDGYMQLRQARRQKKQRMAQKLVHPQVSQRMEDRQGLTVGKPTGTPICCRMT